VIKWLGANYTWVFSGIGALAVGIIIDWFRSRRSADTSSKSGLSVNNAGAITSSTMAGRDVNIHHHHFPTASTIAVIAVLAVLGAKAYQWNPGSQGAGNRTTPENPAETKAPQPTPPTVGPSLCCYSATDKTKNCFASPESQDAVNFVD
jgi:hypothetical protein